LWIGTDVKESCYDLIGRFIWIVMDVAGSFHDKFEVICGLD
jgi:hypothetical protein